MVNIDATDKPKFDQMLADMMYFFDKYGPEVGQTIFATMLAPVSEELADMSDEEKSFIFASGVGGLQKAAGVMHDQLFPFGHAGEPLNIEE
jgi:hypothetical protein